MPRLRLVLTCLLMVAALFPARSAAEPQTLPPLPDAATRVLARAGYRAPRPLALAAGVAVVAARKGRRLKVVAVVCDGASCAKRALELASVGPRTTLTATVGPFTAGRSISEARVTAVINRASGARESTTTHYLVRTGSSPELACWFLGARQRDPGPRCGSGLMEWVTVRAVAGAEGQFEVESRGSGLYSARDPRGAGCVQRSPIRGRAYRWRYTIPPRGKCVRRPVETGGNPR
jgi:hypothetical protein